MIVRMTAIVALVIAITVTVTGLPSNIRIGGLFEETNSVKEIAFKYAVDYVNRNREILPATMLTAQIERLPKHDSFYASKRVCSALKLGVAAMFGPTSSLTAHHVQSICDTKEVPHLETRWDFNTKNVRKPFSINLYPHPPALRKAYLDLLNRLGWTSFTILYESNEGIVRLQDLLKFTKPKGDSKIIVRQLEPGLTHDYRPMFKELKNSGTERIVLDCAPHNIQEILKQAQQVGMMTAHNKYIIASLDLHMVELEDFRHGGTNITAFRLVNPTSDLVQQTVRDWIQGETLLNRAIPFKGKSIQTETAMVYDAVLLFAKALSHLDAEQDVQPEPLSCEGDSFWQQGSSLVDQLKQTEMEGLSGRIQFDSQGFRSNFQLDIIELRKEGLIQVGSWESLTGANFSRNYTEQVTEVVESLHNKTVIVSTILNDPFLMLREESGVLHGNDRYEGYSVDLIHEISKILGFNYTIKLVDDGKYGGVDPKTGRWTGMIGELLDRKADLVVADITITYEREKVVDFTMPFLNLGVTILYQKPNKKDPNLFSFMSPLSVEVWIYIVTAYLVVSLIHFTLSRLSPYEPRYGKKTPGVSRQSGERLSSEDTMSEALFTCTGNPVRTVATQAQVTPEKRERHYTIINSFWFIAAALLGQGADILPSALSTRMIAGLWWFFTLIMISSYTANLAAFLTVESMESPIESAEELARQQKIKYGAVQGGSTAAFFRDSKINTYAKMWAYMEQHPNVFMRSNRDGIERVLREKGNYAFMMESTNVEYVVERVCELTQIGGLLDSKGYGIGLPPNSPYRTPITNAILKLQEGGKLHLLKEKWWKVMRGGGKCEVNPEGGAAALELENVGGIFLVLVLGLGISCLIAVLELIWNRSRRRNRNMEEIASNGLDKLSFSGPDLAAHGSVSLSRCNNSTDTITRGSRTSLPTSAFTNDSCAVPSTPNGFVIPTPCTPTHYLHYHHQEQCPHYTT